MQAASEHLANIPNTTTGVPFNPASHHPNPSTQRPSLKRHISRPSISIKSNISLPNHTVTYTTSPYPALSLAAHPSSHPRPRVFCWHLIPQPNISSQQPPSNPADAYTLPPPDMDHTRTPHMIYGLCSRWCIAPLGIVCLCLLSGRFVMSYGEMNRCGRSGGEMKSLSRSRCGLSWMCWMS